MLRYYILHAHQNGLTPALRRIGRKILIRRDSVHKLAGKAIQQTHLSDVQS